MSKWKKLLISSVVVFILTIILKFMVNGIAWDLLTYVLYLSVALFVVAFVWGFYNTKKERKKMPLWYKIIFALTITFGIIFIIAKINSNKMDKVYNNAVMQYEVYQQIFTR